MAKFVRRAETAEERHIRLRIRSILNERKITQRALGIAAGHGDAWASDVLGGKKPLSLGDLTKIADFLDLPTAALSGAKRPVGDVAVLEDRIAAGPPLALDEYRLEAEPMPFRPEWLISHGVGRPLCVRVGDREQSMVPIINPGDLVLLDCSDEQRSRIENDQIYAVKPDRHSSTLKRLVLTKDRTRLLLLSNNNDKREYPTQEISLSEDETVDDYVIGRVVLWWKGQSL